MIDVILTDREFSRGAQLGVTRRLESMRLGFRDRNLGATNSDAEQWYANIAGALGELAAAKALNVYWPASVNAKKMSQICRRAGKSVPGRNRITICSSDPMTQTASNIS